MGKKKRDEAAEAVSEAVEAVEEALDAVVEAEEALDEAEVVGAEEAVEADVPAEEAVADAEALAEPEGADVPVEAVEAAESDTAALVLPDLLNHEDPAQRPAAAEVRRLEDEDGKVRDSGGNPVHPPLHEDVAAPGVERADHDAAAAVVDRSVPHER